MKDPLSGGRVHIIGIGGIGMSAIAEIMAARGLDVQGSDQKDGANLRRLSRKGIKVFVGQCAENLEGATTVVISTAVKDTNPELKAAREKGLPVFSRADTLAALMKGYRTISVTGSHGKTTTTAMIGWMMVEAGLDPTVLVGGVVHAWGSNARIGSSRWMVVEADEFGRHLYPPADRNRRRDKYRPGTSRLLRDGSRPSRGVPDLLTADSGEWPCRARHRPSRCTQPPQPSRRGRKPPAACDLWACPRCTRRGSTRSPQMADR